ncbi:hypothetical protein BIW11_11997 [Tropilaelaps mercedesae]|uniref:Uncharacterized protein n=1 Tax=Tropilaelaps mercedesae TaxID=418985 RepID=A0A1V9X8I6_9ACAR|nr:hypothetical protein BIW11_11997 [Tropilaelaps mercedesae]
MSRTQNVYSQHATTTWNQAGASGDGVRGFHRRRSGILQRIARMRSFEWRRNLSAERRTPASGRSTDLADGVRLRSRALARNSARGRFIERCRQLRLPRYRNTSRQLGPRRTPRVRAPFRLRALTRGGSPAYLQRITRLAAGDWNPNIRELFGRTRNRPASPPTRFGVGAIAFRPGGDIGPSSSVRFERAPPPVADGERMNRRPCVSRYIGEAGGDQSSDTDF